jgi:hypothetical protein
VEQIHCAEGGAIHVGPEPWVYVRENMGEARSGERMGQPLSFDKNSNPDADIVHRTEGKTDGARDRECPDDPEGGYAIERYGMPDRSERIEFS